MNLYDNLVETLEKLKKKGAGREFCESLIEFYLDDALDQVFSEGE